MLVGVTTGREVSPVGNCGCEYRISVSDSFDVERYCQSLPVWGFLDGVRP